MIRLIIGVLWIAITIGITLWLDGSSLFSTDPFLRRLEINLLMVCSVAFFYGLVKGRALD